MKKMNPLTLTLFCAAAVTPCARADIETLAHGLSHVAALRTETGEQKQKKTEETKEEKKKEQQQEKQKQSSQERVLRKKFFQLTEFSEFINDLMAQIESHDTTINGAWVGTELAQWMIDLENETLHDELMKDTRYVDLSKLTNLYFDTIKNIRGQQGKINDDDWRKKANALIRLLENQRKGPGVSTTENFLEDFLNNITPKTTDSDQALQKTKLYIFMNDIKNSKDAEVQALYNTFAEKTGFKALSESFPGYARATNTNMNEVAEKYKKADPTKKEAIIKEIMQQYNDYLTR